MAENSPHEKGLFKVMIFGTALSFGGLGAIIGSMKDFFRGNAAFAFSYRTIIGFVIGFVVGWAVWALIQRLLRKSGSE